MPWFSKLKTVIAQTDIPLKFDTYYKVQRCNEGLVTIHNHEDNSDYVEPTSWCKHNMVGPIWISPEEFAKLVADTQAYCVTRRLGYYQSYGILNDRLIERFG